MKIFSPENTFTLQNTSTEIYRYRHRLSHETIDIARRGMFAISRLCICRLNRDNRGPQGASLTGNSCRRDRLSRRPVVAGTSCGGDQLKLSGASGDELSWTQINYRNHHFSSALAGDNNDTPGGAVWTPSWLAFTRGMMLREWYIIFGVLQWTHEAIDLQFTTNTSA